MKSTEKETYTLLEQEEKNLEDFASALVQELGELKNHNLVVDLLHVKDLAVEDLLRFQPISNRHKENKKSFVLVNDSVNIDEVPEEISVVPTLHEAEDLIQMEEIERDLGF